MRLFSADIYSHITSPHKAERPPGKPAAVCSGANGRGARSDPHIESLHAPKSVAHPCSSIGSRARMPRSRRRRHRRIDSGRLRIARRVDKPFARRQSPGGLPPRGAAVTMVFPDTTRVSGGCDARARSSRADPRQSRKPSLPRGLLVHLCRQTASARATGHGEPFAIGSPA
jgi:hypothetical protein